MRYILWIAMVSLIAIPTHAQVLQGQWVDDANVQIDKIRKSNMRLIVVDSAGKPVRDAKLDVTQVSHAFQWGVKLDPTWIKDGVVNLKQDAPVYRCFNGVSLEAMTAWPKAEPSPGEWNADQLRKTIGEIKRLGLAVRWGPVLSNDAGRLPDWVNKLDPAAMVLACQTHVQRVSTEFGDEMESLCVIGCAVGQDIFTERIGSPIYGRLYEAARTKSPHARLSMYFADGLSPQRTQAVVRMATDLRDQFIPLDEVDLEVRLSGTLVQAPVARSLKWVADAGLESQLVNVEVAGESPTSAAINLETLLLTAFASPGVNGIWFAGLTGDSFTNPEAALIDATGNVTSAGRLLDQLVHTKWRTVSTIATDALGNARLRGFAGAYRAVAHFPDGTTATTNFWLPPKENERVVLIQALATEVKK
ncbi:MAG: endo-1,4-beta-xylanase [Phycisphaeraceae bacterium]|nr:endo-1,4-beta-xylanase [Phycisphaeraceae bacterium]